MLIRSAIMAMAGLGFLCAGRAAVSAEDTGVTVLYRRVDVDGLEIFYREAGPKDAPVVLLLHGFPSSSHQFRNLIPLLADKYHVVAPDFPGYGQSASPAPEKFSYSLEKMADVTEHFVDKVGLKSYVLYLHDIGGNIGFRLASRHPDRVTGLIIQNTDAYEGTLNPDFGKPFFNYFKEKSKANEQAFDKWLLTIEGTKYHYLHGARHPEQITPDVWVIDQAYEDRPGNREIQLALFYDLKTNFEAYKVWQEYFRKYQPPALILWGRNDGIFTLEGAEMYKRDLKNIEYHYFETGHFALEEDLVPMASLTRDFLAKVTMKK